MITTSDFEKCESYIGTSKSLEKDKKVLISTDSRELSAEHFFLAIEGRNFNALNFLEQVIAAGCKYVIHTESDSNKVLIEKYQNDLTFISTQNSVKFLQEITSILSERFQNHGGKLIAISGSNGKTTTKEMLFHLLKTVHPKTICTKKNNNNHIGVPLTLLQINEETKFAIIELGSNHPGEIKILCDIAKPRIGYTTNIGDTHLEFFQNRKNVFKEEGYLCKAIFDNPAKELYCFVNSDDEFLKLNAIKKNSINIGENGQDYKFSISKNKITVKNENHEYPIINKLVTGKHNLFNLCAAFSIAKEIDSNNTASYIEAIQGFTPTSNRSQWLKINNNEIFLDAYNANPSSMLSAIDGFVEKVGLDSNYCLVLGDMNELGDKSELYHGELAKKLLENHYKNFIFVGKFSSSYNKGCDGQGIEFLSTDALSKTFKNNILNKYKYVFIKGSRSLQLESLVDIN